MPIAFDASSNGAKESGTSPLTISHVVGSGSDRILFVVIQINADVISGVTYNGVAMTELRKDSPAEVGVLHSFYLVNPDSGTHDISISYTGDRFIRAVGLSYSGASQTGVPDATGFSYPTGAQTSVTANVTTVADNCWLVGFGYTTDFSSWSGNVSARAAAGGGSILRVADSNGALTPAGAKTATLNSSPAGTYAVQAFSFAPAVAVVSSASRFLTTNSRFFGG